MHYFITMIILLNHYLLRGGYLNYSSLDDAGSRGYYWSATPSSSRSAYYLYFYSGYVDADDYFIRYNGFSVRCVAAG